MESSASFYYGKILPAIQKKFLRHGKANKKIMISSNQHNNHNLFSELVDQQTHRKKGVQHSTQSSENLIELGSSRKVLSVPKLDKAKLNTKQIGKILQKIADFCKRSTRTQYKKPKKRNTQTKSYEQLQNYLESSLSKYKRQMIDPTELKQFKQGQQQIHFRASFLIKRIKPRI